MLKRLAYAVAIAGCLECAPPPPAEGGTVTLLEGGAPSLDTWAFEGGSGETSGSSGGEEVGQDARSPAEPGVGDCSQTVCGACWMCQAGQCVPAPDGTTCGEASACSVPTCARGACQAAPAPNDCGARVCGPSPSGCHECGTCPAGLACAADGACTSCLTAGCGPCETCEGAACVPTPNDCGPSACDTSPSGCHQCGACQPGYACEPGEDGSSCADLDECAAGLAQCPANAECVNTPGGHACTCQQGYAGDGATCKDVDECADATDECHLYAVCANTDGGYTCACWPGFAGDGKECQDVDECATGNAICPASATCTNSNGGYICTCKPGYTAGGLACEDIDECATGKHDCDAQATCTNTPGGYACACPEGYTGDGKTCEGCGAGSADVCGSSCLECSFDPSCYAVPFEAWGLPGWQTTGLVQVVGSFGTSLPSQGKGMVSISNAAGSTDQTWSRATFPDCLPAGDYSLSFDWKVFSAELLGSCGTQYQDSVTVELQLGETISTMAKWAVDDFCPKAECSGCGDLAVGLEQVFGGHLTPWMEAKLPFSLEAEGAFAFRFTVADVGDPAADTVLLLDDLVIAPCEASCQGSGPLGSPKACGYDGCGGSCGTCAGAGEVCFEGGCCVPSCSKDACGSDGCGGICTPGVDTLSCCAQDADCEDGDPVCTPQDTCAQGLCQPAWIDDPQCCDEVPYTLDFTAGNGGITFANSSKVGWTWTKVGKNNTTYGALYYGDPTLGDYEGTGTSAGTATTPPLALPRGKVGLSFRVYLDIESADEYDRFSVRMKHQGGDLELWTKQQGTLWAWETVEFDLTAFAGQEVQVVFMFDTVDGLLNDSEGVYIDDLDVTSTCKPRACLHDIDCDDGLPATEQQCVLGWCGLLPRTSDGA